MFESLDLFRLSGAMAQHAGRKQAIAAQNAANADTPGYLARDLPDFRNLVAPEWASQRQKATRVRHLQGGDPLALRGDPLVSGQEGTVNGNQVSLEAEMLKSVAAKRQHDRALAIYKHGMDVLRASTRTK